MVEHYSFTLKNGESRVRFLPRDATHKRGLGCHAVSVRLCVSVKTNKHIFKIFSASGSQSHYSFSILNGMAVYRPPPNGGVECRWGSQKSRFWAHMWLHCVLSMLRSGIFLGFGKWGCKIKVGGISSRREKFFFSTPQMGCKHHPMGVQTPPYLTSI